MPTITNIARDPPRATHMEDHSYQRSWVVPQTNVFRIGNPDCLFLQAGRYLRLAGGNGIEYRPSKYFIKLAIDQLLAHSSVASSVKLSLSDSKGTCLSNSSATEASRRCHFRSLHRPVANMFWRHGGQARLTEASVWIQEPCISLLLSSLLANDKSSEKQYDDSYIRSPFASNEK